MIADGKPFPGAYSARESAELPSGQDVVELKPGIQSAPGGMLFEVSPDDGDSWVGIARASTLRASSAVSGLFTTPGPRQLCVVVRGTAYLVDVARRHHYVTVAATVPVTGAVTLREADLLLLVTPWTVIAIDGNGVAWRTERLAIDGVRLDEADSSKLAGLADPESAEPREFVIDLKTGAHEGGAITSS